MKEDEEKAVNRQPRRDLETMQKIKESTFSLLGKSVVSTWQRLFYVRMKTCP